MLRTIMTAALLLALPLTAAGCGQGGTSAAQSSREDTHQTDGTYQADDQGRVSGSDQDKDKDGTDLGDDLKKAGEDLTRDAKDAARDAGDAAKDVLDGVTDDPNENSSLNAGNSSDPPVENK